MSTIGKLGIYTDYALVSRPQYKLDMMTSHDGGLVEVRLSWSLQLARLTW